ncbi:hypothetical protein KUTeg_011323 [Tegillarca granosa]|uniref:NADH dehydrogenase [ubiquinone] 1 alpha subcomplex subunit 9, mitochondrial n=1 Tax=Tegillarca granosa TaxID=220873 RepID=A0ABQ9F149_TEGGR|nr:hypothetical protein KUTeg_011323 [Tegillarca granosa]
MATVSILRLARCGAKCPQAAGTVLVQKRNKSDLPLTSYKRGKGGRSSFNGTVATIFGATGQVGRSLVNRLGKSGSQVIIPYRGDVSDVAPLKLCGDLGQILFVPCQLDDEEALRKSIQYSNVVINCTGSDNETRNWSFEKVHVEGPRNIARIARECGVKTLVHFSAMNASPDPQKVFLKDGSGFLKSKYKGELAVREEFPEATIFRPSEIFGSEDRFILYYCHKDDVTEGLLKVIYNPETAGKTYELLGPEPYYLSDLVRYFLDGTRIQFFRITDIGFLFRMKILRQSLILLDFPIDCITDNPTGAPTLEDLGVKLTRIEEKAVFIHKALKKGGYYDEALGEFPDTPPPPAANFMN